MKSLLLDLDRDTWKIIRELFSYARKLKEINSELVPGLGFGWVLKSVDDLPGILLDFENPLFSRIQCLILSQF